MTERPANVILVAVALPLVVLSIDFSGVAVALPLIGEDLGVSSGSAGWVINAFALGAAGPLLVSGRLADRFGRRRMLLAGVCTFSTGTIVVAAAPAFWILLVGRVVQGVATSLFMTASLSVVSTAFDGPRRPWAIGMWSAIGSTAAAAAPVVGGLVVDGLGWRWFFALNLPLLVAALGLALRVVPESYGDRRHIDAVGAVLVTASVTAVVLGFQEAGVRGWGDPVVRWSLVAGTALFALFVLQQARVADRLVDAAIVRARAFRPPVAVAFWANWGFGALNILLTYWLQDVRGESAAMTGVVFLAYSVPFAVLGALTGRVVARLGPRPAMVLGMALVVASFLALTQLGADGPLWVVLVAMACSGVGQGLAYNVSTTTAMAAVPDDDAGVASGVLTALRNVGVAAGVAVATLATSGTTGAAFTAGLRAASWAIVVVSLLGLLAAASVRPPQRTDPGRPVSL